MPRKMPGQTLDDLFFDCESAERGERWSKYKTALSSSIAASRGGGYSVVPKMGMVKHTNIDSFVRVLEKATSPDFTKGLSPDQIADLTGDLESAKAMVADIRKEWTTTNPDSGGLVGYDLQQGVKELIPFDTPLRNTTPRDQQGFGLATHWKRLLSITNAGVGTVGQQSPFFNSETVSTTFQNLQLRRPPKINYATDSSVATYVEWGSSDEVSDKAYFAGLGFENVDQLSLHSLTWAHLLGEERAILYGRGGASNGYQGAVAAPVISIASSATGGGIAAGTYFVKVTANAGFGESVVSNEVNTGALTGGTNQFTVTVTSEPVGGLNYNLYVGTATGAETLVATFVGNSIVVTVQPITGGRALPASDSTADANGFDGWLSVLPAQGGYVKRINGKLSTTNPGTEFQTLFQQMYQLNRAQIDDMWMDSNVIVELGDLLKNSSSVPYRIALSNDGGTTGTLGTVVIGIENQVKRNMVEFNVHPFMPLGAVLARTLKLPFPTPNLGATTEMRMVRDYMAIEWPKIEMARARSTYCFGTMVHYAPAWSAMLLGVQ